MCDGGSGMVAPVNPAGLSDFQDEFCAALMSVAMATDTSSVRMKGLAAQPGFAVYRNTVIKGCIDALQSNYPAVNRLVGDEWFRAAAAIYVRENPPDDARLLYYGVDFAAFIESFPPALGLPYLASVARLDRLWTEAHVAADDSALDSQVLTDLDATEMATIRLRPRASARWVWSAEHPAYTLWNRNRFDRVQAVDADDQDSGFEWQGEGGLLVRHQQAVMSWPISEATCAFLGVCANEGSLPEAVGAAMDVQPSVNLSDLISTLMQANVFKAD